LPDNLINSNIDFSLWAYSTIAPGDDAQLVNIYIVNQKSYLSGDAIRHRMWLHDLLDDEGIPYQVVIKGYWAGRRKYFEDQFINVEKKHEKKAKRLINEFKDTKVALESPEDISVVNYVDGIPQIKCPSCNKEIDFDYNKCPFCNCVL